MVIYSFISCDEVVYFSSGIYLYTFYFTKFDGIREQVFSFAVHSPDAFNSHS